MSSSLPSSKMPDRRLVQIDGLRCLAIASVAWSHWAPHSWQFGLPWGTGVQLFFVISGFLITGILLDSRGTDIFRRLWGRFYARRMLRIFPVFYATILLACLLNYADIRSTWVWQALYLANFRFALEGGASFAASRFSHFWSLAVEEQFYLVWPLLVLRFPLARLERLLCWAIVATPFLRILSWTVVTERMVHLLTWSNHDALGVGALLAFWLRLEPETQAKASRLAGAGLRVGLPLAVIGGITSLRWHVPFPIFTVCHTGMILFYGSLVFHAARGVKGIIGQILANRAVAYVGKISYGVYVFHLFAPSSVTYLARLCGLSARVTGHAGTMIILSTIATLATASLSWHFFERPFNSWKRYFPYASAPSLVPPLEHVHT